MIRLNLCLEAGTTKRLVALLVLMVVGIAAVAGFLFLYWQSGSQAPKTVGVDLPSESTAPENGTIALQLQIPSYQSMRYTEGVPVIIIVEGGYEQKEIGNSRLSHMADLLVITFLFPGAVDNHSLRHSDGVYDYRGMKCIEALRDVVLFAAGALHDIQERTIDEVVGIPILHDNIGIIGFSNGGNLPIAMCALYGSTVSNYLRYVIQWETPVCSQVATRDFGEILLEPLLSSDSPRRGHFFNPRYSGYGPEALNVSYEDLCYNSTGLYRVFHDGTGDGNYSTIPESGSGRPTPDLNQNGTLESDEDFPLDIYPDSSKLYYSRPVTHALEDRGLLSLASWPADIGTPSEADEYWDIRESVRLLDDALSNMPDLEGMYLASVEDHVQSNSDKFHVHQAFDAWNNAGGWIQINPSRSYLVRALPNLQGRADLPNNAPNTAPSDWTNVSAYCISEDVFDEIYQTASVWQMADRAHGSPPMVAALCAPLGSLAVLVTTNIKPKIASLVL